MHLLSRRAVLFILTALALSLGVAGVALAAHRVGFRHVHGAAARQQAFWRHLRAKSHRSGFRQAHASGVGAGDSDLAFEAAQYGYERTAPALTVSGQALIAAGQQAAGLGQVGGPWQAVTTQPFNAQPANYTDPFWSNIGAGFSLVGGRTTALAQAPDGSWYAGAADGGVWRSTDQGKTWHAIIDFMPSLSVGALAVDPTDGSVWLGTGRGQHQRRLLRRHRRVPGQPRQQRLPPGRRHQQSHHLPHDLRARLRLPRRRLCGHQQRPVPLRGKHGAVGGDPGSGRRQPELAVSQPRDLGRDRARLRRPARDRRGRVARWHGGDGPCQQRLLRVH